MAEQEERLRAERFEDDIRERLLMAETRIVQLQRQMDEQRDGTKRNQAGPAKRARIFAASSGNCFYCSRVIHEDQFTIDHVWPLSKSGSNDITNCVAACHPCNKEKGDSLPTEGEIQTALDLYRPKKQPWTGPRTPKKKKDHPRTVDMKRDPGLAFLIRSAKAKPNFTKRDRRCPNRHHGQS